MMLRARGFTLIELLITVTIFVFLIMLAGPMYAEFMANHQIRNASDAILNGVQQAQSAAVRGNTLVRLLIDPSTGTGGWQVLQTIDGVESATPVQIYTFHDGAPMITVTTKPDGARQITFDGFGRVMSPKNVDGSDPVSCIKVTNGNISNPHKLNVAIISNSRIGAAKLCDPAASSTEPQACPAECS